MTGLTQASLLLWHANDMLMAMLRTSGLKCRSAPWLADIWSAADVASITDSKATGQPLASDSNRLRVTPSFPTAFLANSKSHESFSPCTDNPRSLGSLCLALVPGSWQLRALASSLLGPE